MSTDVKIFFNEEKKHDFTLDDLKNMVIREKLYFGVLDEISVYQKYEGTEVKDVWFVLFSNEKYGRGFQLKCNEDGSVELLLNYPSTRRDIFCFYQFIYDYSTSYSISYFFSGWRKEVY